MKLFNVDLNSLLKCAFILIITCFLSCKKDWLDAKGDKKLSVPSTLSDFQAMLDNARVMNLLDPEKGEIASDGHFVTDVNFNNASANERKDTYIWAKSLRYTTELGNNWVAAYNRIIYCNTIIERLSLLSPKNEDEKIEANSILGQALFQRASVYYQLSQIYTPPITIDNKTSEYGLIMRLESDVTLPSKRSSIQYTFDQITKDLLQAAPLLPNRPKILTRASRSAAMALLSRVYLYLGDYNNSLKYAYECLSIYSTLLDFNNIVQTGRYVGALNTEVLYHSSMGSSTFITTNCLIDNDLINSYDSNDLRGKVFFFKNANGNYQFQGNYNNSATNLFNGLSVDEMFLTRAECYARLGKVQEAMMDINTLLKKRWNKNVPYVDLTAANANDALVKVLLERKKSLLLRGIRWMDLRRLNLDDRFKVTLTRVISGTTYTLEPNSYKYAFPIPDDIIELTGVKQNPGW